MEDHHVDRLGVEAQQCVKLTSTNRSIGLIAFIVSAHLFEARYRPLAYLSAKMRCVLRPDSKTALCWPGDIGGVCTPDPIPNSAVKSSSADGTKSQDLGE